MRSPTAIILSLALLVVQAQQMPDSLFRPRFNDPAYALGKGPRIAIDQAHHNFHTRTGRYQACARVLESDGFRVVDNNGPFTENALAEIDALVIANALHASNEEQWALPTPSAFAAEEIVAVRRWVESGGGLFLIADHMPFAGAVHNLALAFGFVFSNGFALKEEQGQIERFHRGAGLLDHEVTRGVDTVVTFTGSAFDIPEEAAPIIALDDGYALLEPDTAWRFSDRTPQRKGSGWFQAAVLPVGKGRVAILGEAAMFSAQRVGPQAQPIGMNSPAARDNVRLLRNIARWLTKSPAIR